MNRSIQEILVDRADLVTEMFRSVEPCWPKEGCGFVFERSDGELVVIRTENRADLLHEKDPERYPRGAEAWYEPNMKPWFAAVRSGSRPRLIFHSHPDAGAYFSDGDQESAVVRNDEGRIVERHPGVWHLVISVRAPGVVDEAALFAFDQDRGTFTERARFDARGEPQQR